MDVIVAELAVVLLAAENVGFTVDDGDCVVGACEGEPASKSASASNLATVQVFLRVILLWS